MQKSIKKWLIDGAVFLLNGEIVYDVSRAFQTREEAREWLKAVKKSGYANFKGTMYKITSVEKAR